MHRLLLATTALIILSSPALADGYGIGLCDYYAGHIDVEGKLGSKRDIGETSAFLPIACSEDKLLFGDIRFKADSERTREGNVGIGARLLKDKGVLGFYGYADRKISGLTRKTHDQVTLGSEWLTQDWEVRGNAYIPLSGERRKTRASQAGAFVQGANIFTRDAQTQTITEEPLWGGDIEGGIKLPGTKFWLHTAVFAFDGDNTDTITGVRARATYNITDNIALTGETQYDDLRGRNSWAGIKFTMPFGGPTEKNEGLKARMTASPVRDIDIVTSTSEDRPLYAPAVAAVNNDTGQAQRVIYVDNTGSSNGDGSKENPYNTLAQAQAALQDHDILYVKYGDGTSTGMDQGIVIDKIGVQMIGSGSALVYDGAKLTTSTLGNFSGATLIAASEKPTITNVNINPNDGTDPVTGYGIRVLADKVSLSGLRVDNAGYVGISALASGAGVVWDSFSMDNVITSNNATQGLVVRAGTDVGDNARIENVSLTNIVSANNATIGIFTVVNGGSFGTVTLDTIESYNNGEAGLRYNIQTAGGGSIDNTDLRNLNLHHNAAQGLWLLASNGTMTTLTADNIIADHNGENGITIAPSSAGIINNATFENISASHNGISGIITTSATSGVINSMTFEDVVTNSNASSGFVITGSTSGGSITASVESLISNQNGQYGLHQSNTSGSHSTLTLRNATLTQNTVGGLHLRTQNANSQLTSYLIDNDIITNVRHGITIDHDASGTGFMALDFGGGGNSTGGNRIFGNGTQDTALYKDIFIDLNNAALRAENNWWGADADPTTAGQVMTGTAAGQGAGNGGTVDATPRLSTDPRP